MKLDKPGGFLGADAVRAARSTVAAGEPSRRLARLSLADSRAVAVGGEPVRVGDRVAGRITSAGYGYTLGTSIAYAYLPAGDAVAGTAVTVDLFGEQIPAVVV